MPLKRAVITNRSHRANAIAVGILAGCALLAPAPARASCDVIPGTQDEFRSALGTINRPFAIPGDVGQQLTISLNRADCDAASPGFVNLAGGIDLEDDYFVTILFKPSDAAPGSRIAVLLGTEENEATCSQLVADGVGQLDGGSATCRVVAGGTEELRVVDTEALSFRFPDTDALVLPDADDLTYTGPTAIAVTTVLEALPFELASLRCAQRPGLEAAPPGV